MENISTAQIMKGNFGEPASASDNVFRRTQHIMQRKLILRLAVWVSCNYIIFNMYDVVTKNLFSLAPPPPKKKHIYTLTIPLLVEFPQTIFPRNFTYPSSLTTKFTNSGPLGVMASLHVALAGQVVIVCRC